MDYTHHALVGVLIRGPMSCVDWSPLDGSLKQAFCPVADEEAPSESHKAADERVHGVVAAGAKEDLRSST